MLEESLLRITGRLDQGGVPYMLLGGFALAMHGIPRMTRDLDLALGVDIDQLERLLALLRQDFKAIVEDPATFAKDTNVLLLEDVRNGVRVDLVFTFIDFERNAIEHADAVALGGGEVKVVSLENLVVYKMLAGRERDKEDVAMVMAERKAGLDIPYISATLAELAPLMQLSAYDDWLELSRGNA